MDTSELPQKKPVGKQAPRIRKSVMLPPGPHRQLDKMAQQFKVTNTEFVEAAIAYFSETGQSPFAAGNALLTGMESKVEQQAREIRQQNADIGNRLVAIIRDVERGLGKHLQAQQGGTLLYLERIERTILTYLTQLEDKMLTTLLEQVMRISAETSINRSLLEVLLLKHGNVAYPYDKGKQTESASHYDAVLEHLVMEKARQLLNTTKLAPVFASEKPLVAVPTKPGSSLPKKAASGEGPAPVTPPSTPAASQ